MKIHFLKTSINFCEMGGMAADHAFAMMDVTICSWYGRVDVFCWARLRQRQAGDLLTESWCLLESDMVYHMRAVIVIKSQGGLHTTTSCE